MKIISVKFAPFSLLCYFCFVFLIDNSIWICSIITKSFRILARCVNEFDSLIWRFSENSMIFNAPLLFSSDINMCYMYQEWYFSVFLVSFHFDLVRFHFSTLSLAVFCGATFCDRSTTLFLIKALPWSEISLNCRHSPIYLRCRCEFQ